MLLRDKFWLWGHPEGRYNQNADGYGCPDVSRMTPMEGCVYLGVRNTFMVPVGVDVNRRQYNKSFKTLNSGTLWTQVSFCPNLSYSLSCEVYQLLGFRCSAASGFSLSLAEFY